MPGCIRNERRFLRHLFQKKGKPAADAHAVSFLILPDSFYKCGSMILFLPCDADGLSAAVLRNTQDEKSYGDERKKDASVQDSFFLFIL